jgi:arabinogalactan oligomer/maltooligosaccharide transport system permease protein
VFDWEQAAQALSQVATTLIGLVAFVAILETFLYLVFVRGRRSRLALPIMLATPALIGLLVLAINPALLGVVVVLEVVLYPLFIAWRKPKYWLPMMLITPAIIFLTILYIYPLLWEFNLSFTKMNLRNFFDPGLLGFTGERNIFVGFQNYIDILSGQPVLQDANFYQLFGQTLLWTAINIFFHVTLGIGLALMLNRAMRGRTAYRALLILPWAIPATASLMIWRTEFNFEYGAINQVLAVFGIPPIPWLSEPFWNFVAMIMTNVWLGVPFMMVITLGGLQSISNEYYEAAEMDGANTVQQFRNITLPLLRPVLLPAVLLGVFLTFNNILVPFFINPQELETSDILVTALYRAAFQYSQYGFAAAFAFCIFAILLAFTIFYVRQTNALKGAYE